jgi:hypothetical protein
MIDLEKVETGGRPLRFGGTQLVCVRAMPSNGYHCGA